jgi:hypothetical protein
MVVPSITTLRGGLMSLRPYASRPLRATVQVLTDVLVVSWAAGWIWIAVQVHQAVVALGTAGYRLRDAADAVASHLREAGDVANRVPLAGDRLSTPLDAAGGAAGDVAGAGQQLGDGITAAATPLAVLVVAATVLPVITPWLLLRLRYARRAGATAQLATSPAGTRLLALRALATASATRLTRLDDDPVAAWVREDEQVMAALATLELRQAGLRPGPHLPP